MKLAILIPSVHIGGAEKHALTIAKAAIAEGMQVYFLLPKNDALVSLKKDFIDSDINFIELDIAQPKGRRYVNYLIYLKQTIIIMTALFKIKPQKAFITVPWVGYSFSLMLACKLMRISRVIIFQLVADEYKFNYLELLTYKWIFKKT